MRDKHIDFLRFIGLSLIILAHVDPPAWLFQLRNFDVPLMVLVSGMAFGQARPETGYASYLWKRVKRLVFPVWLFLSVYFLAIHWTGVNLENLNSDTIMGSFLLLGGIGYVWIVRVFLVVACLAPFIVRLDKKVQSNVVYLNYVGFTLLLYAILLRATHAVLAANPSGDIIESFIFYGIAFSVAFAIGFRFNRLTVKELSVTGLWFFLVFTLLAAIHFTRNGHFVPTQEYKYPPSLYYMSYALAVSIFVCYLTKKLPAFLERFKRLDAAVFFVGQNSLWIYLWHIPCIRIMHKFHGLTLPIRYLSVYAAAFAMASFQVWAVRKILAHIQSETVRKNITQLLTG